MQINDYPSKYRVTHLNFNEIKSFELESFEQALIKVEALVSNNVEDIDLSAYNGKTIAWYAAIFSDELNKYVFFARNRYLNIKVSKIISAQDISKELLDFYRKIKNEN